MAVGPLMIVGVGLTVKLWVPVNPHVLVKDIVAVPACTPVTIPVPASTDATEALLVAQVPPVGVTVSVWVAPTHAVNVPVMVGVLAGFTVTYVVTGVLVQPVPG